MTVGYLIAHCDDEYAALPLIRAARRQGRDQRFFVLTRRLPERLAALRFAETRAFLAAQGIAAEDVVDLAAETGAADGALAERLLPTFDALLPRLQGIRRIVTPAWEGGHFDHDMSAGLALALAAALGGEVVQYSLYNGRGLAGPLFRGGSPLPEGGPVDRLAMSAADWLAYALAVRHFPSQIGVWSTLWPAMFLGYGRYGYGTQKLTPEVLAKRPHPGPLLYERRGRGRYEDARLRLDGFAAALAARA